MVDHRNIFSALARVAASIAMQRRRKERGLSIRDLHKQSGISASSLRQIEAGTRWPNDSERERLALAIGTDFFDLPRARQ